MRSERTMVEISRGVVNCSKNNVVKLRNVLEANNEQRYSIADWTKEATRYLPFRSCCLSKVHSSFRQYIKTQPR